MHARLGLFLGIGLLGVENDAWVWVLYVYLLNILIGH